MLLLALSSSFEIGFHFLRAKSRRSVCFVLWYYDVFFLFLDYQQWFRNIFLSFHSYRARCFYHVEADLWFNNFCIRAFTQINSITNLNSANYSNDTLNCLRCCDDSPSAHIKTTFSIWPANVDIHLNVRIRGIHFSNADVRLIIFRGAIFAVRNCIRCAYANSLMQ